MIVLTAQYCDFPLPENQREIGEYQVIAGIYEITSMPDNSHPFLHQIKNGADIGNENFIRNQLFHGKLEHIATVTDEKTVRDIAKTLSSIFKGVLGVVGDGDMLTERQKTRAYAHFPLEKLEELENFLTPHFK